MRLKTILLIHIALCTGVLLFAGVALVMNSGALTFNMAINHDDPIEYLAPIMAVTVIALSTILFNKLIGEIDYTSRPVNRFTKYQTAFIVKMALLEGGALMNIVACIITKNALFLAIAAIVFFIMSAARPTKDKVYGQLGLQDTDDLDGI